MGVRALGSTEHRTFSPLLHTFSGKVHAQVLEHLLFHEARDKGAQETQRWQGNAPKI